MKGIPTSLCPVVEDPRGHSTALNANYLDSCIKNSMLRFLLSPNEELADGSSKIWETFTNVFIVLKFLKFL